MIRIKPLSLTALLATAALMPADAMADGARDWLNVPVDMNFLYLYYTYSSAETSINSPLPIEGTSVSAHVPILRYARSLDIGGKTGGVQIVVPYGFVDFELDGTNIERSIDGIGDIMGIFIANIFGAPALSKEEYAKWTPETYLTGAISVTAPTGKYDPDRLVNFGKNRWGIKPQLSYGIPVKQGQWFSLNGAVEFYTDNDEYLGSRTLSQKALFTTDAHYSVNLNKAIWVSADAIYTYGGETKINGIDQENEQSTLRLGFSGSLNFTPADAVSIAVTSTVWKRDHTPDAKTFSINYSHAW